MSELIKAQDAYMNPYAVEPALPSSKSQEGTVLAANAEARVIAEVKAQVLMAKQFARNPAESVDRILNECKRPTLAEAAVYSYPRGKETVTGPSIRLAEMMARNWGNNTFGYDVLERKFGANGIPGCSVIRAYSWDLESNTYISRQFEVKHWRSTKSGGYALTDDRDIYELEANMASRRLRACILQMIPGDITTAAVNACRMTESSGLSARMADKAQREKIVSATIAHFGHMGVQAADLEAYLKAKQEDWTADHLLALKEMANAIKDNVRSVSDFFPHLAAGGTNETIDKAQVEHLMKLAKQTGRQGDISDWLKKQGIAKFAGIPTGKFKEVEAFILSLSCEKPAADDVKPAAAKTK